MIVISASILLTLIVALAMAAGQRVPGNNLRLANPVVLPTAFVVVAMLDFIYMGFDQSPQIWGVPVPGGGMDRAWVALIYGVQIVAIYVGLLLGLRVPVHRRPKPRDSKVATYDVSAAAWLAIILATISAILFYREVASGSSLAQISAEKALLSSSNRLLPIVTWMAAIGTGFYLTTSKASKEHLTVVWLVATVAAALTGVRFHVLTLTVFYLASLARRGKGPGVILLPYVAVGGFVLMTFLRFVRASAAGRVQSFGDFLEYQGGPLKTIFGSVEMGSAEITALALQWAEAVSTPRMPGEGFLGLALGVVPRSVIEWKPFPASTEFTFYIAPGVTSSQLVIGSPMELTLELGAVGAIVACLVAGFLFGLLIIRAGKLSSRPYFAYSALALGGLIFLRTDIANLGVYLWPLLLFLLVHGLFKIVCYPRVKAAGGSAIHHGNRSTSFSGGRGSTRPDKPRESTIIPTA